MQISDFKAGNIAVKRKSLGDDQTIQSQEMSEEDSQSSSSFDEAVECRPLIVQSTVTETEMITRSEVEGGDAEEEGGEGEGADDAKEEGKDDGKQAEKEEEKEEASAGAKVGSMKAGDYTVHILVQNARQLIADGDDTSDPVIEFMVGDVQGKTTKKKDVSRSATVKFNEHIFLELKGLSTQDAQNAILKMTVKHQGFFMCDLIGQYEMPISKIYNMADHTLLNQQLGLNDPEADNSNEIKGFVGVSINVQGPNDEAQELNMVSEKVMMEKPPLIPTAIKKKYKQAYFRFFYAQNLPIMDIDLTGGFGPSAPTIDAYARITYGNTKLKTKVYKMKDDEVVWMQEMLFPIELPIKAPIIQIQIFDEDFTGDELSSSLDIPIEDILNNQKPQEGQQSIVRWINLYGGPNDYSSSATAQWMNKNPDRGSEWKGRIMVEYFSEDSKYPKAKLINLKHDLYKEKLKISMQEKKYFIIGQISSGLALPDENIKKNNYKIKVCIGKRSWESAEPKHDEANYARWDFQFEEAFEDSYQRLERLPDVFVYLMINKKPACYYRAKITDFEDPNPKWKWLEFTADKSVGVVTEQWKAGFFGMRLYARSVTEQGEFKKEKNSVWAKGFERRNRGHLIRCAVYQCALLPPADSNGSSDPYVEIWQPAKDRPRTSTSFDTNNPIFYELKEFYAEIPKSASLEEYPPIILNVFDTDEGMFSDSSDFMGRAVVFLHQILTDEQINDGTTDKLPFRGLSITDDIPYPQFFPIKQRMNDDWDPETGPSILCSFSIVDYSRKYKVPTDDINLEKIHQIRPGIHLNMPDLKIKEFQCKVTILGLRELVSPGILPIRKAFVKFNLKSLLKAENAKGVEDIKTQPKEGGSNPNLKTKIEFQVKVSQDKTFCPQMTCNCFDQLYLESFPQPQIGTFTLKVGKTMFDIIEENEEEHHDNEKLIYILKELKSQLESQQGDLDNRVRTAELLIPIKQEVNQKMKSKKERQEMKILENQQRQNDGQIEIQLLDEQNLGAPEQGDRPKTQKELKAEFLAQQKREEEEREAERKKIQDDLAKSKVGFANVVYPIYKWDERLKVDVEVEKPNEKIYMPVGYNLKKPNDDEVGNKHYRRYYNKELESVIDPDGENLVVSPFLNETITKNQKKKKKSGGGLKSLFSKGDGNPDDDEEQFEAVFAGKFKGILKVYNEQEYFQEKEKQFDQVLKIQQLFKDCYDLELAPHNKKWDLDLDKLHPDKIESYSQMKDDLSSLKSLLTDGGLGSLKLEKKVGKFLYDAQLQKKLEKNIQCKVRAYILEGFNMAKRDLFSDSDPFLIVKCGPEEFNEEKNYQENEPNPKFNKVYEFQIDFPGAYPLEVWVYDYDLFFGNDLIGKTQVDLDDRFFSMEWQSVENKPIEYRELYHKDFDKGQGTVKMWVDIHEMGSKNSSLPATFCDGEPQNIYEARLIIWKTKDIPHMDVEGCSDVFVRTYFDDPNKDKTTDTHWRNSDGKASFNWRIVHHLKSLQPDYVMTIEAWDKDIIASNDLIGSFKLDIGPMFNDCYLTNRQTNLTKGYWESYLKQKLLDDGDEQVKEVKFDGDEEVDGTSKDNYQRFWVPLKRYDDEKKEEVYAGQVQCTLHIYPKEHADKNPQGVGRDAPNSDPYCPPPVGRIELSLNPFKMIMQLIPPKMRRKICMALCCLVCLALCAFMAPMILSNLISSVLTSIL